MFSTPKRSLILLFVFLFIVVLVLELPCKQGYSGFISRYCTLYGTWEDPIENCEMLTCFADSGFPTVEGNQIVYFFPFPDLPVGPFALSSFFLFPWRTHS